MGWLRRSAATFPAKNVAKSLVEYVTKYQNKSAAIFPDKSADKFPDKAAKMYLKRNVAKYPDKNAAKNLDKDADKCLDKSAKMFPNKNAKRYPSKNALHSTFVRFANSPLMEDKSLIIIVIFKLSLAQFFIQPGTNSQ